MGSISENYTRPNLPKLLLILLTILCLLLLLLIVTSPIRPWASIRPLTIRPRARWFGCGVEIVALWEGLWVLIGGVVRKDGAVGGVVTGHRVPRRLTSVQAPHLTLRAEAGGGHVGELLQAGLAGVVEAGGGVVRGGGGRRPGGRPAVAGHVWQR